MCVVRAWRWMCNIMHITGDVQMELVDMLSVRSALPGQTVFVFLVAQQTCRICWIHLSVIWNSKKKWWCSASQGAGAILDMCKVTVKVWDMCLMVLVKGLGNYMLKIEFGSYSFMSWCILAFKARKLSFSVPLCSFSKVTFRNKEYWDQGCWCSRRLCFVKCILTSLSLPSLVWVITLKLYWFLFIDQIFSCLESLL